MNFLKFQNHTGYTYRIETTNLTNVKWSMTRSTWFPNPISCKWFIMFVLIIISVLSFIFLIFLLLLKTITLLIRFKANSGPFINSSSILISLLIILGSLGLISYSLIKESKDLGKTELISHILIIFHLFI